MLTEEKRILLSVWLNASGVIDKLALESSGVYLGTNQTATWMDSGNGSLVNATNITFDMGESLAGPVFAVHLLSTGISTTFGERVAEVPTTINGLSNYDIYRIENIELTIED